MHSTNTIEIFLESLNKVTVIFYRKFTGIRAQDAMILYFKQG